MTDELVAAGWMTPRDPGPSRRMVIASALFGIVVLVAWAVLATGRIDIWFGSGDAVNMRVKIDPAGVAVPDAATRSRVELRDRASVEFLAVRHTLRAPRDGVMVIDVAVPAGLDAETISMRTHAPDARVRVSRTSDGAPRATITSLDKDNTVDVLVLALAEQIDVPPDTDDAGALTAITGPLDDDIAEAAARRRHAAGLRRASWWLVGGGLVLCVGTPILWWRRMRRHHTQLTIPVVKEPPAGPPGTGSALDAARLTAGVHGIDDADAFAAHVLELVANGRLKARRAFDEHFGDSVLLGMLTAHELAHGGGSPLDAAAIALLDAVATDDESGASSTVVVADAPARMQANLDGRDTQRLVATRAAWSQALATTAGKQRVVEHPPWKRVASGALAAAALSLVAAAIAAGSGSAAMWLVAALMLVLAPICGAWAWDLRRWSRVRSPLIPARAQWLAWRSALGAGGQLADQRSIPYAVATADVTNVVRVIHEPSAVGLAAVSPKTVASLRRIAGATT